MRNKNCTIFALALVALRVTVTPTGAESTYQTYTFRTLAGYPGSGSADGTGSAAQFNYPQSVAVDRTGNVYVADSGNHTIRKVTPAGVVTTLAGLVGIAGNADGTGSAAQFSYPEGVAVDTGGNVYVADSGNLTIRKVTPAGVVSTLAGGSWGSANGMGSAAQFSYPRGVAVDSADNVYVADSTTIRKVTPTGLVTTLAGLAGSSGGADGTRSTARFIYVKSVAVDSSGNVYVADSNAIRKVTPAGVVTTMAGLAGSYGSTDGTGRVARFNAPQGVAVDSGGNVYVADYYNSTIRKVTPAGVVTTLAGLAESYGSTDGTGSAARFNVPYDVAVDSAGIVYVADGGNDKLGGNNTIRKVTPEGVVTTLAGEASSAGSADGKASAGRFNAPSGVAAGSAGNVYVSDYANNTIRKVTAAGEVTTLAGLAGSAGSTDGTGSDARFHNPTAVAVDGAENVYVADTYNNTIRKVTPAGLVTTLAGLAQLDQYGRPIGDTTDGIGSEARFNNPTGVAVDGASNVYVADSQNYTIRKVTPTGEVTTVAGLAGVRGSVDGTGSAARFGGGGRKYGDGPGSVAVDSAGNLYAADSLNTTIRKVTPTGVVTTLAGVAQFDEIGFPVGGSADGTGSTARFGGGLVWGPTTVAVDRAGIVYVADGANDTIRKVTPAGLVTTLAGAVDTPGSSDGTRGGARFNRPAGVAVDSAGNLYVADTGNNTIRKGYPARIQFTSGPELGFSGGHFGFMLTGPAGRLVVVETSSDLVNWLPIWTNTFAGALNFRDSQSGVSSKRFYRARTP